MKAKINPKVVVSIVYITAMFMAAMDATIVNVALQTISKELQVPPSAMGTVNVGYLVSLAVFLPISGWLGDRFGTKRVFLAALFVFTTASALCGIANDITSLNIFVLFKVLVGALTPVGMAMLFRTFSPEERPKISVYCVANCCRTGSRTNYWWLFVDQMSWRWAFYINLPFGIVALLFGLLFLAEHVEKSAGRFDSLGFILSAPGFAMLIYALSQGPSKGWISPEIMSTGIAGVVFITLFIIVELKVKQPMLDLRLLKEPVFRKMSLISLFSSAGLLGMLFVFPLMYQNVIGASALESGLTTFPEAIGLMISSQIVPWSYKKLGARKVISIG